MYPCARRVLPVLLSIGIFAAALGAPASAAGAGLAVNLTSKPAAATQQTTATFRWSISPAGPTSYTCSRDGAAYVACTQPRFYSGNAQGRHTFVLRAKRGAMFGAIRYSWVVDRRAPGAPSLVGGGTTWTRASSVTVRATSTDELTGVRGYQSQLRTDGSAYGAIVAGASRTVATAGDHVLRFRAIDNAGNVGPWSARQVRIDRTAPVMTSVVGGSAAWSTITSVTVSSNAADAGSGVASIQHQTSRDRGATWSAVGSGASVTVSLEGETLVRFRAIDVAGNVSGFTSVRAAGTVRLDRSAPELVAVSGGNGGSGWQNRADVAVFAFATDAGGGSGVVDYQVATSINSGASWTSFASVGATGFTSIIREGRTMVRYRALDAAGNSSATSVDTNGSLALIDRTAPGAPIVTGGTGTTVSTAVSVRVSAASTDAAGGSGTASYEVSSSFNGAAASGFAAMDDAFFDVTAHGVTVLTFRAIDAAGNVGAASVASTSSTVRLDRVAPAAPVVTGGSDEWSSAASRTLDASSTETDVDAFAYETSTDGGTTWTSSVMGDSVTVSAEGDTRVRFLARDTSGLWSEPSAAAIVRLDRVAPSVPVAEGGTLDWVSAPASTVTASATDATSGGISYQHRSSVDAADFGAGVAGSSVEVTHEGETRLEFIATDAAGNSSEWSVAAAESTVRLDRTAPAVPTLSGGSDAWSNAPSDEVSGTSSDNMSGITLAFQTSLDGGTWTAAGAGPVTVTAEGTTLVRATATDGAGNSSVVSTVDAAATVRLDRVAPTVPVMSGGSAAWSNVLSLPITGSSTDLRGVTAYEHVVVVNGGVATTAAPGAAFGATEEGTTEVTMRAGDAAGNWSEWSAVSNTSTAKLDRTGPVIVGISGGNGATGFQDVASIAILAAASDEPGSGVATWDITTSHDGGDWTDPVSIGTAGLHEVTAEGTTQVRLRAVDAAGNIGLFSAIDPAGTAMIDRSGPASPTVAGAPVGWSNDAEATLTASTTDNYTGVASWVSETSADTVTWGDATAGATRIVSAEGITHVRFRATDGLGNESVNAAVVVRLDRSAPDVPTASGGVTWTNDPSATVSATSADAPLGTTVTYEYQTSLDGGVASSATAGAEAVIAAAGETTVSFRATDSAGNMSGWSTPDAASTVQLDHAAPTVTASGGSSSWQDEVDVTIDATTDDDRSGVATTEYSTSTDGINWSPEEVGTSVTVSDEGETLVRFRATDVAGTTSTWTTTSPGSTVRIDRTDPTVTVFGGSLSWQSVDSVTVTATPDDASPVTVEWHASTDGGITWGSYAPGAQVTVLAEGETLVQFRVTDSAGNVIESAVDEESTVRIDRTAPTPPVVIGGSDDWSNATSVDVDATSSDATTVVETIEVSSSFAGAEFGAWSEAATLEVTAEGTTLVQFRATDSAGNTSLSVVDGASTVKLDRTLPGAPTVDGGSLTWTKATSSALMATGTDDRSGVDRLEVQSRLNAGGWEPVATSATLAVTAEGETEAQFRVVDNAGNTGAWSTLDASSTVRLDRTAPAVPAGFTGGDLGWRRDASMTVTGVAGADTLGSAVSSGTTGAQYRVTRNEGIDWTDPVDGSSATVTSDGKGWVQMRSVDQAGNRGAWTPSAATGGSAVLLDRTAPVVTVAGGSSTWDNSPPVIITATASDAGSGLDIVEYQTRLDGGPWGPTQEGTAISVTSATQGTTDVRFRAADLSGNQGDWTIPDAGSQARVDTIAPPLTVTGGSADWQTGDSVEMTFDSTDATSGQTVEYRTSHDGDVWTEWAVGTTATVTAEGTTDFEVRSTDGAGNVTTEVATAATTVMIDRTAPVVTVEGGSLAWTNSPPVIIVATVEEAANGSGAPAPEREVSTDGVTWTPLADATSYSTVAEGETFVRFRSTDVAGNSNGWTTVDGASTARIDVTDPTLTASGGVAGWSYVESMDITATADGGPSGVTTSYATSTDGGLTWSEYSSPTDTATISEQGRTLVRFRAVDGASNTVTFDDASDTAVWIDTTGPVATATGGNGGHALWSQGPTVTVEASAIDVDPGNSSGVDETTWQSETRFNGGPWTAGPAADSVTVSTGGVTEVHFRVQDAAGSWSEWTTVDDDSTVRLDTDDPMISATGGSTAWVNAASDTLTATATDLTSDIVVSYRTSLGGAEWTEWAVGDSTTVTVEGSTVVQFRAVDAAGRVEYAGPSNDTTVNLDRSAPTVASLSGGSDAWFNAASRTVTAVGSDSVSGIQRLEYRTTSDEWVTSSSLQIGTTATFTAEGVHRARFRAVDLAGNTSGSTALLNADGLVQLDRTASTGTLDPVGPLVSGSVAVTGTHADARSGVANWTIQLVGDTTQSYCVASTTGTPYSCSVDTTLVPDGAYSLDLVVVDAAGNTGVAATRAVTVDNGGPTGSASFAEGVTPEPQHVDGTQLYVHSFSSGSATLAIDAADEGAGVASVTFPALTGFTGHGTDNSAPYEATYAWSGMQLSSGPVAATVTSNSGATTQVAFSIVVDGTNPVAAAPTVVDQVTNSAPIVDVVAPSDSASGIASWVLEVQSGSLASGSCSGYGPWSELAGGNPTGNVTHSTSAGSECHQYRVAATDNVGRTGYSEASAEVQHDNVMPFGPVSGVGNYVDWDKQDAHTSVVDVDVTWTHSNGATGSCMNQPANGICGASESAAEPGDTLTFELTTTDAAGNVEVESAQLLP